METLDFSCVKFRDVCGEITKKGNLALFHQLLKNNVFIKEFYFSHDNRLLSEECQNDEFNQIVRELAANARISDFLKEDLRAILAGEEPEFTFRIMPEDGHFEQANLKLCRIVPITIDFSQAYPPERPLELSMELAETMRSYLFEKEARIKGIKFAHCSLEHGAAQRIARGIFENPHMHRLTIVDSTIDDKCKNILVKPFLTKRFAEHKSLESRLLSSPNRRNAYEDRQSSRFDSRRESDHKNETEEEQDGNLTRSRNIAAPIELSGIQPLIEEEQPEPKGYLTEEIKQGDEFFYELAGPGDSPVRKRLLSERSDKKKKALLICNQEIAGVDYADQPRETNPEEPGENQNGIETENRDSREFEEGQGDIEDPYD